MELLAQTTQVTADGLTWSNVITLIIGIGTVFGIPIAGLLMSMKVQIAKLETKMDGVAAQVAAGHSCPYVQIRTEHHTKIDNLEKQMDALWTWKREVDRSLARAGMKHGADSEGT